MLVDKLSWKQGNFLYFIVRTLIAISYGDAAASLKEGLYVATRKQLKNYAARLEIGRNPEAGHNVWMVKPGDNKSLGGEIHVCFGRYRIVQCLK